MDSKTMIFHVLKKMVALRTKAKKVNKEESNIERVGNEKRNKKEEVLIFQQ